MADNTVQLDDEGPSSWANSEGWRVTQERPVIKGLTEDQAQYLVDEQPFFRPDGDPEENTIRPVVGTDLRESGGDTEVVTQSTTPSTQEETADPPFNPSEETVSDFEEIVENNDFSRAELLALKEAEANQDDRNGVAEAIDEELSS